MVSLILLPLRKIKLTTKQLDLTATEEEQVELKQPLQQDEENMTAIDVDGEVEDDEDVMVELRRRSRI